MKWKSFPLPVSLASGGQGDYVIQGCLHVESRGICMNGKRESKHGIFTALQYVAFNESRPFHSELAFGLIVNLLKTGANLLPC